MKNRIQLAVTATIILSLFILICVARYVPWSSLADSLSERLDDRPRVLWDGSELSGSDGLEVWTIDKRLIVPPTIAEVSDAAGVTEFYYPEQSRIAWGAVGNVLTGQTNYYWVYDVGAGELTKATTRSELDNIVVEMSTN